MDSANSSSVQSSSGGDEDHDSRSDSISPFLSPPGTSFSSLSHQPSLQLPASSPRPPSFLFDPLSGYLDPFTSSSLHLDMTWAGAFNPNQLPSSQQQQLLPPSAPPHDQASNTSSARAAPAPRSSRKRSRASRREPTTVLTTDTANFRAMVQEFTGIPAPPFFSSSSSMFPRSRLDLFHPTASPAMGSSGVLDPSPRPLLRPLPQKVQVPSLVPFMPGGSSSSSPAPAITATATSAADAIADGFIRGAFATNDTAANVSSTSMSTPSMGSSYQQPPLGDHHQNLLNVFNFQSILQPSPRTNYNSPHVAALAGRRPAPMAPPAVDYAAGGGLSGGLGGGALEGMPSSRGGGSGGDDILRWVEGPGGLEGGGDRGRLEPSGGSYGGSRGRSGCRLNCTGSASPDRHGQKGPENVSARGEGMLDSWICYSD
uniref:VQ domain-containing protein n=1 Tax=Anthurium amnicola TaxID=1678845 RepID=A0A1D1Z5R9_9ARAE